jgi:hypothetical protein
MSQHQRSTSASWASREVFAAQARLMAARQRFADVTDSRHPHVFLHPSVRKHHQLLKAASEDLRRDGVLGYGVGKRVRAGVPTDEPCATVFVTKKRRPADLPRGDRLPRHIGGGHGRRLAIDVVEMGPFRRYSMLGSSTGPNDPQEQGTIGAFATGQDGNTYAITAMHVSEVDELTPNAPPIPFYVPSRMQAPNAAQFGLMVEGTSTGVDAGKIRLNKPNQALYYINQLGPLQGWRPVVDPTDNGILVRPSGAKSGLQVGTIVNANVSMPDLNLESAIVVQMPAQPGDSGAPLVDEGNLLLGTLVGGGKGSNLNVFSPIGLVLAKLGCEIVIPK